MSDQTSDSISAADIPVAVWSGNFTVMGVNLRCHVLSDGRRIIDSDSLDNLFSAMAENVFDAETTMQEMTEFGKWMRGQK